MCRASYSRSYLCVTREELDYVHSMAKERDIMVGMREKAHFSDTCTHDIAQFRWNSQKCSRQFFSIFDGIYRRLRSTSCLPGL
jgi:hypothetical protein